MPQVEYCAECGDLVPRKSMVRKLRPYGWDSSLGGTNLLLYSSYNSSFWTTSTASDAGRISMGVFAQYFRPTYARSTNTGTEARGSQTWTGSGKCRATTATDISSQTNSCFSVYVGAYHNQSVQALTAVVGWCDGSGTSLYSRSWTVRGSKLCYVGAAGVVLTAAGVSLAAAYPYIQVTISGASSKWWWDSAVISAGGTPKRGRPRTAGAAWTKTGMNQLYKTPALCPKCAPERLRKPSEDDGEPRIEEWVEIRDQIESL